MDRQPPAATPAPRRQRLKEIRPQQLLDAALTLFVAKGFAATRAEEVARLAGVSKGTLYLYYPSKEELFKAVVRHNLAALIGLGGEVMATFEGSTAELLQTLLGLWWERTADTDAGGLHKIVLAEVRNFPELAQFYADEVIVPAHHLFETVLRRGIGRGEFRALDPSTAAHAVMAPVIFLLLHKHSFGACPIHGAEIDPRATLDAHVELMLQGLLRRDEA